MDSDNGPVSSGAIFVLPSWTAGQQGPLPWWVSTAGWAAAGQRVFGASWIVTPDGVIDPPEARRRASMSTESGSGLTGWRRRTPLVTRIAAKDIRQWQRARTFEIDPDGPWRDHDVALVWQRHDLFQQSGLNLARRIGAPSVLFVPAPIVWEAKQWSVQRPGWSGLLERLGERPALARADLVACGTELVAEQVRRIAAVPDDRILITPTGVDVEQFEQNGDGSEVRRRLGLEERFVVGWTGSFRRFHALDVAVEAAAGVAGSVLLLVGDGVERSRIEALAARRGVPAVFTGAIDHTDLPAHLAAMDVALVLGDNDRPFHYSPLKLAEYLAAGVPVIATRVGELKDQLARSAGAILVAAGDTDGLRQAITRLRDDPQERRTRSRAAREEARAHWAWDHQLTRIRGALS